MSEHLPKRIVEEMEQLPREQWAAFIRGVEAARSEAKQEKDAEERRQAHARSYARQF